MKNHIKVSVIVPIYNVEEYLRECLDSLVNQTIDSIEVLLIDDGTPDNSGVIAQEYAEKYENFYYFRKENGGLGQARNFGVNYAHGEYIAFLDSDDIVSAKAYEKMYNLAKETNNDLIVGDVVRFNSKRVYNSNLHRRAFNNAENNTHILKKPELVYDTTSWNKLYRLSWWKENNFKFPEHILYEDIPVTIPAHFRANGVSILNDIVYYWRVRDGISKSITQNRTEQKNFSDRLKIMKMVDVFYKENVTDSHALFMKDFKWLDLDLKLYINQFLAADDEFVDLVFSEIKEYLTNIPNEVLSSLRTIDQMKYYLIQNGEKENLLKLLEYEKTGYKALRVQQRGERYIGKFPLSYIPKAMYDMTAEFNEFAVTQKIQKVRWQGNILKISGYAYLKRVDVPRKDTHSLSAYLRNADGSKKIPVKIETVKGTEIGGTFKVNRKTKSFSKYNYKWAGYEVEIDFSKLDLELLAQEKFRVEINLSREGIEKQFYLGQPIKGLLSRETAREINEFNIYPDYNLGYDIVFDIQKPAMLLEEVIETEEKIIVKGTTVKEDRLFLSQGENDLELLVKYTCNSSGKLNFQGEINIEDFTSDKMKLVAGVEKKGLVTFYNTADDFYKIFTKKGLFSLYKGDDGSIFLANLRNSAIVNNIEKKGTKLTLSCSLGIEPMEIDRIQLLLKGDRTGTTVEVEINEYRKSENELIVNTELDFNSEKIAKALVQDLWELCILIHGDNGEQIHPILIPQILNHIQVSNFAHVFTVKTDEKRRLYISVSLLWKWYENTKQKRRLIRKYLYPVLRLLPIKSNRIVFEGWWGQKYHCNPRYLYEYIDRNYSQYECIWSMTDENLSILGKGKTVRRNSLKYHYYMATSKYFVNNVNFMDSFEKRRNQIEIQTMHGTPLKTLGLDVPGELPTEEDKEKFLRRCNRWDYLIVQSREAEKITASCFAYKKKFLETGYPRNDIIFGMNNVNSISEIKRELGIPVDKKVIMYAPTWRRKNQFDLMLNVEEMKDKLGDEYVLLLRIHPFALRGFNDEIVDNFVYNVSTYPSIEKLYVISDIFITDYSSAMFDFGVLNRPILFFTYDLESYRDNLRGFNIDLEKEAPGPLLETSEDVMYAIINIEEISQQYDDSLQYFRKKYCEFETGEACKKIMKIVWGQ